jgi:hypothetical protein
MVQYSNFRFISCTRNNLTQATVPALLPGIGEHGKLRRTA